jgi:hypothetical protein
VRGRRGAFGDERLHHDGGPATIDLKKALDAGALTPEEYAKQRKRILDA